MITSLIGYPLVFPQVSSGVPRDKASQFFNLRGGVHGYKVLVDFPPTCIYQEFAALPWRGSEGVIPRRIPPLPVSPKDSSKGVLEGLLQGKPTPDHNKDRCMHGAGRRATIALSSLGSGRFPMCVCVCSPVFTWVHSWLYWALPRYPGLPQVALR